MEYEFIERDLIGLKSGSESVSIYIGLRKMNSKERIVWKEEKMYFCRYLVLVEWCSVEEYTSVSILGG